MNNIKINLKPRDNNIPFGVNHKKIAVELEKL